MIIKIKYILQVLGLTFILSGCIKIGEYYAGLHMQPNMDNSPIISGLNVFGILKTGSDFDTINHYFEVQNMIDFENLDVSLEVVDASIQLTRTTVDGTAFFYSPVHLHDGLYFNEQIETAPGDRWDFVCITDSFEVFSSCIVPNIPTLASDVEVLADDGYRFSVQADETAFMYFAYILNGEKFHMEKKIPVSNMNTVFNIKPEWQIEKGTTTLVYIFAYDKNLREYNTTSNTLFKPNAFRHSFSTVDGGYGTFGAISSLQVVLDTF